MIIVLRPGSTDAEVADVCNRIEAMGYRPHTIRGDLRTVIGAVGDDRDRDDLRALESLECVESVKPILQPFKLASREVRSSPTVIVVGGAAAGEPTQKNPEMTDREQRNPEGIAGEPSQTNPNEPVRNSGTRIAASRPVQVGGTRIVVMAGPCSVESRSQVLEVAHKVKAAGATVLRGGAFKPRTSPYAFQGLEEEGLKLLAEARRETGLPVVTEVMEPDKVEVVAAHADILQVGARNVQNFSLLRRVAECGKPVLLKRGMATSIQEFLLSAEYILTGGNPHVILCERGIRTFETSTRFTLDLNAVPVMKRLSHLPVMVDPSHGTGYWEYVEAMARAGIACGADGLLIEVHPRPAEALSDGPQSLKPDRFATLMTGLRRVAEAIDRTI